MTKIEEMMRYCEDKDILSFAELVEYASENRGDWFRVLITDKGTQVMSLYLLSKAHKAGLLTDAEYDELSECVTLLRRHNRA